MSKSEVALKMMELISKNAGNYKLECINSIYYITIEKDVISFTEWYLRIESGNSYISIPFINIYSMNVYNTHTVIHFKDNSTYLLNYKGGK